VKTEIQFRRRENCKVRRAFFGRDRKTSSYRTEEGEYVGRILRQSQFHLGRLVKRGLLHQRTKESARSGGWKRDYSRRTKSGLDCGVQDARPTQGKRTPEKHETIKKQNIRPKTGHVTPKKPRGRQGKKGRARRWARELAKMFRLLE